MVSMSIPEIVASRIFRHAKLGSIFVPIILGNSSFLDFVLTVFNISWVKCLHRSKNVETC